MENSLSAQDLCHSKIYYASFKLNSALPQLPPFSRMPFSNPDAPKYVPAHDLAALGRAKGVTCRDGGEPIDFFIWWHPDDLVPVF